MRTLFVLTLCFFTLGIGHAQKKNPDYDAELAQKLGADDYGMKYYVFAILKTGENSPNDPELRQQSFAGHMQNIKSLVDEGKLIVAGPFDSNELSYRGLFILDVESIEKAKELLQTDPAIREGFLDTELIKWYGSAALPEYLEASDKIWKVGF